MLQKLLRNFKVTEITFCFPFVEVTMRPVEETGAIILPPTEVPNSVPPAQLPSSHAQRLALQIASRPQTQPSLIQTGTIETALLYRVATAVDAFGPVFTTDWCSLSEEMVLSPGDFVWLRFLCRNTSDRVVHEIQLAMDGIEFVRKQPAILIRGVNGWPREEVRCAATGIKVAHINPGEDYSLHCIVRVPTDLSRGKTPRFIGIKPEFNILKQLR